MQVGDVEAADRSRRPRRSRCRRARAGRRRSRRRRGPSPVRTITPTSRVLARLLERVGDLDQRLGAERVAHLGAVDGDLRDPVGRPRSGCPCTPRPGSIRRARALTLAWRLTAAGTRSLARPRRRAPSRRRRRSETPEERLTYHELLLAATRAAARLVLRGAGPGDRVGIALPPGPRVRGHRPRLPAAARARHADRPAAVRARAHASSLRGAEVLVTQPLGDERRRAVQPRRPRRGRARARRPHLRHHRATPRPVELTFGHLAAHVRAAGAVLGSDPDERWLVPMPLSHVGGLMVLVRSAAAAGTVVLEPPPFDADRVARLLREGDITLVSLVPDDAGARARCGRPPRPAAAAGAAGRRARAAPACCAAPSRPASPSPRPTG